MDGKLCLLDVVALVEDVPAEGVRRGHVGTIVELHAPKVYEVEFSDDKGCTYAITTLRGEQLLLLRHKAARVP